jgi:hypothetical protein
MRLWNWLFARRQQQDSDHAVRRVLAAASVGFITSDYAHLMKNKTVRAMTREAWLACSDPLAMLCFLHGRAGGRKFRLFATACARDEFAHDTIPESECPPRILAAVSRRDPGGATMPPAPCSGWTAWRPSGSRPGSARSPGTGEPKTPILCRTAGSPVVRNNRTDGPPFKGVRPVVPRPVVPCIIQNSHGPDVASLTVPSHSYCSLRVLTGQRRVSQEASP